ncbi:MAG TPA: CPBP family intramembrane glutamic endopeptidase [Gemmataceae bacterium]|nr:CPBP family intramembrane glutamic endopeptidase [Gemmataceae bacterium]
MSDELASRRAALLVAVGFEGGLGLLALLLGWLLGQPPLDGLHLRAVDGLWGALAALPMLLGFLACVRWPVGPLARIKRFSDEMVRPFFAACSLIDLAGVSVLAGLGEELLFRGVVQGVLARWLGPWLAVAAAGVLFGLVHPVTPTYFLLAALAGAYLGCLFLLTGNLLVPVIAHAVYDAVALAYVVRFSGGPGGESGQAGSSGPRP